MIPDDTIECWKMNYRLDRLSWHEATRWWDSKNNGMVPSGAVAAIGLLLEERKELMAKIEQLNRQCEVLNDSRYPYTYACDYMRGLAGYGEGGTKLSRANASQVRQGIADAIGMADDELARKLADYYKSKVFHEENS